MHFMGLSSWLKDFFFLFVHDPSNLKSNQIANLNEWIKKLQMYATFFCHVAFFWDSFFSFSKLSLLNIVIHTIWFADSIPWQAGYFFKMMLHVSCCRSLFGLNILHLIPNHWVTVNNKIMQWKQRQAQR